MTDKTSLPGAAALTDEAIAEGYESVAEYVAALKQSSATYFAERNSARDAYRRHRDESEARGKLINIVLGLVDAPAGANVVQAVAAALSAPAVEPVAELTYAQNLAKSIFESAYKSDPHYASGQVVWECGSDLITVLTQIDNMVSGMVRLFPPPASPAEQAATQAEAMEPAMTSYCLMCEKDGHRTDECWSTHGLNSPRDHELFRLARSTAPTGAQAEPIYHEGVNIERLQQACRAFGLRTDDSMETFVSPSVFADHANRLTSAVLKHVLTRPAEPAILRELTDALRELIDFKSDIKVADLIRRAEKLMDGQGEAN